MVQNVILDQKLDNRKQKIIVVLKCSNWCRSVASKQDQKDL